jgi:hypothetical protein
MTTHTAERLYELLPAVHRLRDAERGYPLRSLLAIIAREVGVVEEDIAQLYADWFIETCDEWVVPYIGDLLGVRGLYALAETGFTSRAFVANTLSYRRRKGTATMLEQLARDTTQWNARVVELFELLGTTQYLNHPRPHNVRTPDLRQTNALQLLDTPFDSIGHTADVRRIAAGRGKHNIPNIGIFLWRLQQYYVPRGTPRPAAGLAHKCYAFSPLGNDMPLFNRPQTETTITHLADEVNVPGRLRRRALYDDLESYRDVLTTGKGSLATRYFSQRQPVLQVYLDQPGVTADCLPLQPEEIIICDLSDWEAAGWEHPQSQIFSREIIQPGQSPTFETKVAVDPVLGRLAVLKGVTNAPTNVEVSSAYGSSGDLGGGPYDRRFVSQPGDSAPSDYENTVAAPAGLAALYSVPAAGRDTIADAIDDWKTQGRPDAVIQIEDSRTYEEDLTIDMADGDLVVQAANGQRPTLIGDVSVTGNQKGRLALNGLLIAGSISIDDAASVRQLDVMHCTLVPGVMPAGDGTPLHPEASSIVANSVNTSLAVRAVRSITGPLCLDANLVGLRAQDCIIQSPPRACPADLRPTLVSTKLSTFPTDLPAAPKLRVTIGGDGPYLAALTQKPTDLATASALLQEAVRNAHPAGAAAFAEAHVLAIDERLIVLPGAPAEVTIDPADGDPTADRLHLTQAAGEQRFAVVSGSLEPFSGVSAPAPELTVVLGDEGAVIELTSIPATPTLDQVRDGLRTHIRQAHPTPAFSEALIGSLSGPDRLLVIPGVANAVPAFDVTDDDATTAAELRLAHPLYRPAIGGDRSGALPGPITTLERVTVLGPVHVKELTLASEVIFAERVRAVRRQAGCVRFSYVPPGSQTPRRFRCQPQLAIATALEQAEEQAGGPLCPAATATVSTAILGRLVPTFTSTQYGDPAYAQLGLTCPAEISTGAEDGSEMGAFSFLKQPQRTANLRSSLDEYLRFGLEAGIFFVT